MERRLWAARALNCSHQISVQAAVVALCPNPVSMVLNWGTDGGCFGAAPVQLEKCSYHQCCHRITRSPKLAEKMEGDSVLSPQVLAASIFRLIPPDMHYLNQMRGMLLRERAEYYWMLMSQTCPGSLASSSAWRSASCVKVPQVSSFYKGPPNKAAQLGCDILTLKLMPGLFISWRDIENQERS